MAFAFPTRSENDQSENGEYTIVSFINRVKPECSLCEKNECDEYLLYNCHCWGCRTDDYVCKNCSLTTALFTHLCVCFRQNRIHFWYDLRELWKKKGNKTIVVVIVVLYHIYL